MDTFSYFEDELRDIDKKLEDLTTNYKSYTTEEVFDRVKIVCDSIVGHLKKQEHILLVNVDKLPQLESVLQECQKDRARVEEELGQLVMVHVNEPEYDHYLNELRRVIEQHREFCERFYSKLKEELPASALMAADAQLNDMILHTSDYNSIQAGGNTGLLQ